MLDVTLENLQANPKHETQLLLSVTFDLRDGNLNHASLISSSGQETTVHSNGTFTLGSTGPTGWRLQTFVIAGHLYPTLHHRIIGPPGSGNTYSNADSSIAGNSHNNPFLNRSASFVITGPDITSNTQISTVYFYFMAGPFGEPIKGVRTFSTVPEPSTELLLGLGTLGLMGLATVSRKLIST